MLPHANNKNFVEMAIERGKIEFIVHGNLAIDQMVKFPTGMHFSPPTYNIKVTGESVVTGDPAPPNVVHLQPLEGETAFRGELQLKGNTPEAVQDAIVDLERWADLLCVAQGMPKIQIEIQVPIVVITIARQALKKRDLQRFDGMLISLYRMTAEQKLRVESALWWYRKASNVYAHSLFDAYAAFWNVLEILCNVAGNRTHKGPEIDEAVQKYLSTRKRVTAGDISHCYNSIVKYGIPAQMKSSLSAMLGSEDEAEKWIHFCFKVKPDREQLYQIRNDINHGNIHENNPIENRRVYLRGMILQELVYLCLNRELGQSIRSPNNGDIDSFVRQIMAFPDDGFGGVPIVGWTDR